MPSSSELPGTKYTIQVAPEDCTGCALCVEACPAKDKTQAGRKAINMAAQPPLRETERANWDFFLTLPDVEPGTIPPRPRSRIRSCCARCSSSPAPAPAAARRPTSSCSPSSSATAPWSPTPPAAPPSTAATCPPPRGPRTADGRGPAWSNSLFEDNAEFGLGFRLTLDKQASTPASWSPPWPPDWATTLADGLLNADQTTEAGIREQRERVAALKEALKGVKDPRRGATWLNVADYLVKKSVWIIGGDGWAYDIGYGGLDHVLASGRNVNILVLDTEVYSNTGGQASKSTPRAAVAKFAANGKGLPKKDLGMIAMTYGYVYVARVAMGSSDQQTLRAFLEADAYDGPSLIIAYSHCIAHGIDMRKGLDQQKLAVNSGIWPLYRYNPALAAEGKNPLTIDSKDPTVAVQEYAYNETRYRMLVQATKPAPRC